MKDPEDDKELLNVELGNKMVLLMDILKESYLIGDKVLVFSQSLLSLDLIEKFLSVAAYDDTYGTWNHGQFDMYFVFFTNQNTFNIVRSSVKSTSQTFD